MRAALTGEADALAALGVDHVVYPDGATEAERVRTRKLVVTQRLALTLADLEARLAG